MMTLMLPLNPELQARLAQEAKRLGIEDADCALRLLDHHLPSAERRAQAAALIESWIQEEDDQEQKQTGDFLVKSMDEDRLSERKRFPPDMEGVSW
jgi:hypothetical protein